MLFVFSFVFNIRGIVVAKELKNSATEYSEEIDQLIKDYENLYSDNEKMRKERIRKERLYARTLSEKELSQAKQDELLFGLLDAKEGLDEKEAKTKTFTAEKNSLKEQIIELESENAELRSRNESLQSGIDSAGVSYKQNNFQSTVPVWEDSYSSISSPGSALTVKTAASGWFTMEATYYDPECDGCIGITKTGIDVRNTIYSNGYRIIAVDPSLIKLGSILEVKTPKETFEAVAGDIGGDIKGNRIDILVESKAIARANGRHNVQLRIKE